ncbi:MAG: hypothetical protein OXR66_00220 [Candidatus Woesearchaeota archaeon]|nr:hypothetical protein [Candidatus Woesearchaeota archaeon]
MADIVKMSTKGQLVVPQEIREQEQFTPGDQFFSLPVEEGVLFKKVQFRKSSEEFRKLCGEIREDLKKRNITPDIVDEAIQWARKKK